MPNYVSFVFVLFVQICEYICSNWKWNLLGLKNIFVQIGELWAHCSRFVKIIVVSFGISPVVFTVKLLAFG